MINIKIPVYPQDFLGPLSPEVLTNYEINDMIRRLVGMLEADPDEEYFYLACGDTNVTILRSEYDGMAYEVLVSKNYSAAEVEVSNEGGDFDLDTFEYEEKD